MFFIIESVEQHLRDCMEQRDCIEQPDSRKIKEGDKSMCLSTVYKESKEPENILMKNVMTIECRNGNVILTDLMGRELTIPGELKRASLVDGFALIEERVS